MASLSFAQLLQPVAQLFKQLTTVQPTAKVTIGVDIGSSAVKVVVLGPRKGPGARPILGQNLVPLNPGQETDPSDAVKSAIGALQVPAARFVNLSVSGQWVIMRIVEMPTMKPGEMKQALPFEAQRYLPFNVQDVVIDGATLGPANANKSWVLIVACKKELLERRIDWVRRAGYEVALMDVDALALANAFTAKSNGQIAERTQVLVNVGAQLTSLVILRTSTPYLVRDIPWGGEKLLRGVAELMGVEIGMVSKELMQGSPSPELLKAMTVTSEALVTELQLSFDYFENQFGHPPEALLLSGGLSQSTGFLEALKSHLTQPVSVWAPVNGLSGQFAVAYGLALRTD